MMHFHEDQDPESNRNFWLIIIAMILVVIIFVAEMFILMLDIQ
jgi:flagellar basal body-associated protein FliL